MNETYSEEFVKSLRRFSSIKKRIVNKIDKIIEDPLMGEPLKYDLHGDPIFYDAEAGNSKLRRSTCA